MLTCSEQLDKIAPALVAAQAELGPVHKSAENTFDRYKYATLGDYVKAITPVLARHKLAVLTSIDGHEFFGRKTSKGNDENGAAVAVSLTIIHDSGQLVTVEGVGEGQDRADKAIFKAITGARKYVLAAAFGLATTDDPEGDEKVGGVSATPKPRSRKSASATGSKGETGILPDRAESLLPEQWEEYISQLDKKQLLPFINAIVAKDDVLSRDGVRHAVCHTIAQQTRDLLAPGSADRKAIGEVLKQQQALLA